MRVWRRYPGLLPVLALLWVAGGCGDRAATPGDAAGEPQYGGTVVVMANADVEHMNSLVAGERYTQELNRYVLFLPLVHYTPSLEYEPALAERWELLGDTGAVFQLRRDVDWHDGVRTTARDVVFTFDRARDPETAFPNAEYFAAWKAVTATDSFTVRVIWEPHTEPLAGLPFLPIMPAHLLEAVAAAEMRNAPFNKNPIGNGPFRFVEYRAKDRTVFEANPDFPAALGGRPYVDRLVWRAVPDATAQTTALLTGSADVALVPPADDYTRLKDQPNIEGIERAGRQFANAIWNSKVAPLDDARVRRALTMAIDRQQIINSLRGGYGSVAVGPIGPFHWAYDSTMQPLPYSPDSARALLRAAGIEDRDGDGVVELPSGEDFEIELKYPATSIINRNMSELIRSNFDSIGVRIVPRPVDFATMIQDFSTPARNFDAILLGWESDFRINLRDMYHSEALAGPYQMASYSNPRVDSLIDAGSSVQSREQARPLYVELQRILREEQPWSYLYYYPDLVLVRDRLQNVAMDVRGALVNVALWWVNAPAPAAGSDSAARSPSPDSAPGR